MSLKEAASTADLRSDAGDINRIFHSSTPASSPQNGPLHQRLSDTRPDAGGGKKEMFELLILTEAGKPVYSYNTKVDEMVTLVGVCQALVNYVSQLQGDQLRFLTTRPRTGKGTPYRISFATKTPLVIVVFSPLNGHIDAHVLISQVHAQIVSIFTNKVLHGFFENRATFDLRGLMTGSEKLIDNLITQIIRPTLNDYFDVQRSPKSRLDTTESFISSRLTSSRPNLIGNRVNIPILTITQQLRDSVTNVLSSAVKNVDNNSILFSILFFGSLSDEQPSDDESGQSNGLRYHSGNQCRVKLVTLCNHNNKARISLLDVQLVWSLIISSENQLSSVESLWMPLCMPRFNASAFLHAHLSSIGEHFQLVQLSSSRDDFHKCQTVKETVNQRLSKMTLGHGLVVNSPKVHLGDVLHSLTYLVWYQGMRQTLVWINPCRIRMSLADGWTGSRNPTREMFPIVHRMTASHLKTLWLHTGVSVALAWYSPTFQLYVQFNGNLTKMQALTAVQSLVKWIKAEEDKLIFKDYQH